MQQKSSTESFNVFFSFLLIDNWWMSLEFLSVFQAFQVETSEAFFAEWSPN